MKSLHRNKKSVSAAVLTELDYSVLNYEELLAVNGAGGNSGGGSSGGPSGSSSSSSSSSSSNRGYPSSTEGYNPGASAGSLSSQGYPSSTSGYNTSSSSSSSTSSSSSSSSSSGNLSDRGYPSSTSGYNTSSSSSSSTSSSSSSSSSSGNLSDRGYPSSTSGYNTGTTTSNTNSLSKTSSESSKQNIQDESKKVIAKVANGIAYPLGTEFNNSFVVTSEFGERESINTPNGKTSKFHSGIDIAAPKGTRINSVADGIVLETGKSDSLGNYIVIEHNNGTRTRYAHCDGVNTTIGAVVQAGEQIGTVGTTGMSTGPHLHLSFDGNGNGKYDDNYYDNPSRILGY